jgi:hypothetical protein
MSIPLPRLTPAEFDVLVAETEGEAIAEDAAGERGAVEKEALWLIEPSDVCWALL